MQQVQITFAYICGEFMTKNGANFSVKLRDQDKKRASYSACLIYDEELRQWTKCMKKSFNFGGPMIWREPKNNL